MVATATSRMVSLILAVTASARAQDPVTRVSVDSNGVQGDGDSGTGSNDGALSADGRLVVIESSSTNLVAGDSNGYSDVFVHDRLTGATVRVSVDSSGSQSNYDSAEGVISGDGRFVAFDSAATNLVSGDTNGAIDVFLHDLSTGVTTRVSVDSAGNQANSHSYAPSLSADGHVVAFWSWATNLVNGDTNGVWDVFIHDCQSGITSRVSVDSSGNQGDGDSYVPSISADGEAVAFTSIATNFVMSDTNGATDIFVHDRRTAVTTRVSIDSSGAEADGDSAGAAISSDAQVVAFWSGATNLVSGDGNGVPDVFVHERFTGLTERVSVDSTGAEANYGSQGTAVSADGHAIAFYSDASNLVPNDTNNSTDVFVRDRLAGTTSVASENCAGAVGNDRSYISSLSADGSLVAFGGEATNLVRSDTNGAGDAFVNDLSIGEPAASWANYGSGFPGTLGIPSLTASAPPAFGASIMIDIGNSLGASTLGLLLIGLNSASIPTNVGGTILVEFALLQPESIADTGTSIAATIPYDPELCGVSIYLQAIELDSGAQHRLSFTPGLQLVIGH